MPRPLTRWPDGVMIPPPPPSMPEAECVKRVWARVATPEMWTPNYAEHNRFALATAKEACRTCVEWRVCRAYATRNLSISGVWGGVLFKRRRR